ncbi:hypothetical protein [Clostridium folliculivorans]|uniref:DUF4825 domain-containing protein n=1 Tax=Clostridium folliculivorans TaxID=2886038 RepID=A0A9W5Y5P4_9CLOT|nr:hypothetical protein [Clostridium folliculivorans]GKU26963.1 hypothetical protein CFOLD11_37900 [Clostridium folliculivorans]GKU29195.1 hypothetical protein CFB3_13010 [Clostridium folliculivorans]
MNKKFKISLTIILLIIIASIGSLSFLRYYAPSKHNIVYSQNLNKKDLDAVLSDYIKNNYFNWSNVSTSEKYEAHKIYEIDEKFGLKYVYMYTLFESDTNAGGSNPLVVIVKEDSNGTYSVVNHKAPKDGDENWLSLKIIFPHKYLVAINSTETVKELQKKMDSTK